jgi:hypothetical protein
MGGLAIAQAPATQPATAPAPVPATQPAHAPDALTVAIEQRLTPGKGQRHNIPRIAETATRYDFPEPTEPAWVRRLFTQPVTFRREPLTRAEKREFKQTVRGTIDMPTLMAAADPQRPNRPDLPATHRYATDGSIDYSRMPLPSLLRPRLESLLPDTDPALDPSGKDRLPPLPIFRSTPAAGLKLNLSDPDSEPVAPATQPVDEDAPAAPRSLPPKPPIK